MKSLTRGCIILVLCVICVGTTKAYAIQFPPKQVKQVQAEQESSSKTTPVFGIVVIFLMVGFMLGFVVAIWLLVMGFMPKVNKAIPTEETGGIQVFYFLSKDSTSSENEISQACNSIIRQNANLDVQDIGVARSTTSVGFMCFIVCTEKAADT